MTLVNLFSPFQIRGKTLKNRCVVPPMVMDFCNADGTCTETFTAYHEAKAKGGFGMIITETFNISRLGRGYKFTPGLWEDGQIEGFKEFTRRIHQYDTVLIAQIFHSGRQTSIEVSTTDPMAPSAIPCPFSPDMPHELTLDEIHAIVEQYGDCARRAEQAGFDGVEIHGAHGYLIQQFMSPYSNKRTDEYGGCLTNRIRFAQEVIRNVRSKVGDDFIVGFRLSTAEHVTGGLTLDDTLTMIPYIDKLGIDYIHASAGVYRTFDAVIPAMYCPHGWNADAAAAIKKVTCLPVISVGRYTDPHLANTVIGLGKADLVAFGRQSLTDPETPNKAKEGRFEDIRLCIGCHHGCIGNLLQHTPGRCILNPVLGHESEYKEVKTEQAKKVMVIGAGPGGLEAALSAAKCGHKVTVYERGHWAGGQFRLGAVPPAKGDIAAFPQWQMHQLKKLGVPVYLETEVTEELVAKEKPDVIIAATGVAPIIPKIPGIERAVTASDVLSGKKNTGAKIVVIGGGCVGAETANHLASNLKNVTLVEMLDDIALDELIVPRWGLLADMEKNRVRVLTNTTVTAITENGVEVSGKNNEVIPADTVVLAAGSRSNRVLADRLIAAGYDVRVIGDANKVGLAGEAISQGFLAGRNI